MAVALQDIAYVYRPKALLAWKRRLHCIIARLNLGDSRPRKYSASHINGWIVMDWKEYISIRLVEEHESAIKSE